MSTADPSNPGTISLSLRLAKAMALARAGRYREAQSLIAGDRTIPDHPLELHALASLVTSEGDYLRALKLWELLLQKDPQHGEARRMIDAIELWLSRSSWMRYWQLGAATLAALLVAVILWVTTSGPATPSRPVPSAGAAGNDDVGVISPSQETPRPTEVRPTARPVPPAYQPSEPAPVVRFPGVSSPPKKRTNPR